jgi:hypothetical protein
MCFTQFSFWKQHDLYLLHLFFLYVLLKEFYLYSLIFFLVSSETILPLFTSLNFLLFLHLDTSRRTLTKISCLNASSSVKFCLRYNILDLSLGGFIFFCLEFQVCVIVSVVVTTRITNNSTITNHVV